MWNIWLQMILFLYQKFKRANIENVDNTSKMSNFSATTTECRRYDFKICILLAQCETFTFLISYSIVIVFVQILFFCIIFDFVIESLNSSATVQFLSWLLQWKQYHLVWRLTEFRYLNFNREYFVEMLTATAAAVGKLIFTLFNHSKCKHFWSSFKIEKRCSTIFKVAELWQHQDVEYWFVFVILMIEPIDDWTLNTARVWL